MIPALNTECRNAHVGVAQTTSLPTGKAIATSIFVRTVDVLESRKWVQLLNEASI